MSSDAYAAVDAALAPLERFATGGKRAFKPGLERIEALLDALGRPQSGLPAVHIGGTNGKGSTASMVASIARTAGLRVGLHTSPHVLHVGERMRVDGAPAPADWLLRQLGALEPLAKALQPSYFEVTLALSLAWFAECRVDLAVVEVGLGGRLDATRVVEPVLSLVTGVDLDHTDLLGDTLEAIAREKAGIFRTGVPALSGEHRPEVRAVLREEALARAVLLEFTSASCDVRPHPDGRFDVITPSHRHMGLELDLVGPHQRSNAALAIRSAEYLRKSFPGLSAEAIRDGLRQVGRQSGLTGRTQVLRREPPLMIDVAHNPAGLSAALKTFEERWPDRQPVVLLALMADKDVAGVCDALAGRVSRVHPVRLPSERALAPERLAEHLAGHAPAAPAIDSPAEASAWARSATDSVLVAGSFHLVGPFLAAWSRAG